MPSDSPVVADCRDCWRTYLFGAAGILDEHPHATATGHEIAYEALGDRLRGVSA